MIEILKYILLGTGIAANLSLSFLSGMLIGDFIRTKEAEEKIESIEPFITNIPLGRPAIVFEIYEKDGDLYTLYASDLNEEYKIRIPKLNLHEGDMFAMIFDKHYIYYDRI